MPYLLSSQSKQWSLITLPVWTRSRGVRGYALNHSIATVCANLGKSIVLIDYSVGKRNAIVTETLRDSQRLLSLFLILNTHTPVSYTHLDVYKRQNEITTPRNNTLKYIASVMT